MSNFFPKAFELWPEMYSTKSKPQPSMGNLLLIVFSGLLLGGLAWQVSHLISKKETSHDLYLLAGAAYYLLVPFATYIFEGYDEGPGHTLWQSQFIEVSGNMQ
jgi:hypothetical protein